MLLIWEALLWQCSQGLVLFGRRGTSFEKFMAKRVLNGKLNGISRDIAWAIAFQRAMRRLDVAALEILIDLRPSDVKVLSRQRFRSQHRLWQGAVWFDSRICALTALSAMNDHSAGECMHSIEAIRHYTEWKFDGVGTLLDFEEQELVDLFPDLPFLADFHNAGRLEELGRNEEARKLLLRAASAMPSDRRFKPELQRRAMRLSARESTDDIDRGGLS